jgi:hypothetical protein
MDNYNGQPMSKRKNKANPSSKKTDPQLPGKPQKPSPNHTKDTDSKGQTAKTKIDASHISVKLKPLWGIEPKLYIPMLYGMILLLILFSLFFLPGLSQSRRNVSVLSTPPGAGVFLNGEYQGRTPFTGTIPAEDGELTIHKPGYKVSSTQVVGAGAQIFGLGLGWFAESIEANLQAEDAENYLRENLLEYGLWSRVGGFGQRKRMKLTYAPDNLQGTQVVAEEGGEFFMPPLFQRSMDYLRAETFSDTPWDENRIIQEFALYTNDTYLYQEMADYLGFPKINMRNPQESFASIESHPVFLEAAYPMYWLLENANFARFQLQHQNYTGNRYSELFAIDQGDRIYKVKNSDTDLEGFLAGSNLAPKAQEYDQRLEAFIPQLPRRLGRLTIGPWNFIQFSPSQILIEDNYTGVFDALHYLEEPLKLAISVPEFAVASQLLSVNLWQEFLNNNPNFSLPEAKYHPGPSTTGSPAPGLATLSYLEAQAVAQWLNRRYQNELGEWTLEVLGEDHFQALLAYSQSTGQNPVESWGQGIYSWTSQYYAPGNLLLNPWLGPLVQPLEGFERIIRGGINPELRAALPENWRSPKVGTRFVLVKG